MRKQTTRQQEININTSLVKKELRSLFRKYLKEGPSPSVTKKALQLTPLWTANPVLPPNLRTAINALPGLFSPPMLSRERAVEILARLLDQNS